MVGSKKSNLLALLEEFARRNKIVGKGPLSVMLILTRNASAISPPFNPDDFITAQGGQVKGLGGPAVQAILGDYGIEQTLAEEGGRTSRGSLERMRQYVQFLNECHTQGVLDCKAIESWWVDRVREYFVAKPMKIKMDGSKSLRSVVANLISAAFDRQKQCPGTMIAGAVMQHLVGAKLTVALPEMVIRHEGFSVADSPTNRKGDFLVHDTVIHVTTAPTENLLRAGCAVSLAVYLQCVMATGKMALPARAFQFPLFYCNSRSRPLFFPVFRPSRT